MKTWHLLATLGCTTVALLLLVGFGVRQYNWNVSALLHMDKNFAEVHKVPTGIILYDAAYDGMLYYQVARDLPALFSGKPTSLDSPYRFQRVLLPALTYLVTLGNDRLFPWAILLINIIATLGTLAIALLITKKVNVHVFAVVGNPAMLVGILYSVTEPVSTFFIMLFFWIWLRQGQRLTVLSIVALLLSLLARETTVFLMGLLFLWSLWRKEWKEALLVLVPIPIFLLWQYYLSLQFGAIGFQANDNIVSLPFAGILSVFTRLPSGEKTSYLLSAIGLMLFVVPLAVAIAREWLQKKFHMDVFAFLLGGLTFTILCMDEHMWGAITSVGRVVTPLYPVYVLYAAKRDTWVEKTLSFTLILVSVTAAIGMAAIRHSFVVS